MPVGMIAVAPSVIVVNPGVPASNISELIAWAKTKGDTGVDFATAGSGSTPPLRRGNAEGCHRREARDRPLQERLGKRVNAGIGGSVAATSEASIVVLPQIKAGRLKAIATTYGKRISAYPSISTATEQGYPGVLIGHWSRPAGACKGTPQPIIDKMNAALQEALRSKETRDQLLPAGIEPEPGSVADFTAFMASERERLGKVARKAGMHVESRLPGAVRCAQRRPLHAARYRAAAPSAPPASRMRWAAGSREKHAERHEGQRGRHRNGGGHRALRTVEREADDQRGRRRHRVL